MKGDVVTGLRIVSEIPATTRAFGPRASEVDALIKQVESEVPAGTPVLVKSFAKRGGAHSSASTFRKRLEGVEGWVVKVADDTEDASRTGVYLIHGVTGETPKRRSRKAKEEATA